MHDLIPGTQTWWTFELQNSTIAAAERPRLLEASASFVTEILTGGSRVDVWLVVPPAD